MKFLSQLDTAARVIFDPANSGLAATEVQGAIDSLNAIVSQGGNANAQGTWLVSGGGVAWVSGFTYNVAAAQYYIMGIAHTSPQTTVTLSASDPSNPRFDIIAAKNDGTVVVLTGTPAAAPELPDCDPNLYLMLTIVRVDAGSSSSTYSTDTVYAENAGSPTEWTGATSGSGIVLGSTSNPNSGTKDVEGTSVANGSYFEFTRGTSIDPTLKQNLVFYIRVKATWPNQKSIQMSFRTATAQVGNAIALSNGFFGFSTSNTTGYQLIVVPLTQFALTAGTLVTKLRFAVQGGGASIGFYFDDASLQGGVVTQSGNWLTQAAADGRYAQLANNLSDLTSAATARTNLGVGAASRTFGVSGTPVLNATTPPVFLDRAYTCNGLAAAADTSPSGSAATITIQSSTDGTTWTTLGTVSVNAGSYSGTATLTSAIAANTWVRGKFTAVNSVANMTATLFLKG